MTTQTKHKLWVEKYRPKTIDQYIFHDAHQRAKVLDMIKDKSIPHLLLSGVQGAGKTALARILIDAMELDDTDVLIINASDERGIDIFRDKIKSFTTTMPIGAFKIVLLEEADALTPDAQFALRRLMEEYADVSRFILTCNYENKITPPIKSRCQHFHFKASDKDEIAEYLVQILAAERVTFDLAVLDKYIASCYPDIRKIVNTVQQNTVDGKLRKPSEQSSDGDYRFKLVDLIERDKWVEIRKLVCSQATSDEWESIYRFMYENIGRAPKFEQKDKWEEAIIVIAEHLYKHSIVADPEINAAAMFIRLGQL